MAARMSTDDLNFGSSEAKGFRQQLDDSQVRRPVRRCLGNAHFKLFPPVRTGAPAANARLGRAWSDTDCDLGSHQFVVPGKCA